LKRVKLSLLIFSIVGVLFGRGQQINICARQVGLEILLFFTLIAWDGAMPASHEAIYFAGQRQRAGNELTVI